MISIEAIAEACHESNRVLCTALGDNSQLPWAHAAQWQKDSAINGVKYRIANPEATPEAQHDAWSADKIKDGWRYGPVKDSHKKTHPCLVGYDSLPPEQRAKDTLFVGIVSALLPLLAKDAAG